jgi:hypothetical protein
MLPEAGTGGGETWNLGFETPQGPAPPDQLTVPTQQRRRAQLLRAFWIER